MLGQLTKGVLIVVVSYLVTLLPVCLHAADDKFYVIAHMVNDDRTAGWALRSGANAVEMDMNFDGNTGKPTRFRHGTPCDCTCLLGLFVAGSVCHLPKACKGGSNVDKQFSFLLKFPALALIYIDSKTDKLSINVQKKAGKEVVTTVEKELFAKGYLGKVLIGSGSNKDYIVAAASQTSLSRYASRIYLTLDQDGTGVVKNLEFLKSLSVPTIVYSNGVSACGTSKYYDEITLARVNKDRGVISNVFIWTLDKSSSFNKYFKSGARGILTNKVPKLVDWAKAKGLTLASPGDDSLPAATSEKIAKSLGTCDCDYHPGGCRVSKSAPAFTACKCIYRGFWACSGKVVVCRDRNAQRCRSPDKSPSSCTQGGGDCSGYGSKNCDCDYHPGGCSISKVAPKGTACKCVYKGGWTCRGEITRCVNEGSPKCSNPDSSPVSCIQGGGDCGGYGDKNCDCNYHPGGCSISKVAPKGTACKCVYKGGWTCGGEITRCVNEGSPKCNNPDSSPASCIQGGGDCGGYGDKNCDCDYHPGGCSISKSSPKGTACKCVYKGGWTCGGEITRCTDESASKCRQPDKSIQACLLGGGDCEGYKTATCDCDYKRKGFFKASGCKIVTAPPKHTACKCRYKGAWTCDGTVVRCRDPNSRYCKTPDKSRQTCEVGGGDCAGY